MNASATRAPTGVAVTLVMTLAYVANILNQGVALVVAEQIKLDLALTDTELGVVLGLSYMALSALGTLPIGRLADFRPRNVIVACSLLAMALASIATPFAATFAFLIVLRALAGAGDAGVVPGATAMIGAYVGHNRRPFALSTFNAGGAMGGFLVYFAVGQIAEAYGWRSSFLAVGAFGLVAAIVVWRALPDRSSALTDRARQSWSKTIAHLLGLPAYRHIVFALVLMGLVSGASWSWISPLLQRIHEMGVAEVGTLLGFGFGVAAFSGSLCYGAAAMWLRRFGAAFPVWAALAMHLMMAISFVVGVAVANEWLMRIAIVSALFFSGAGMVVVFYVIQEVTPQQTHGFGMGFALLAFNLLGQGLGPLLSGAISDALSATHGVTALAIATQVVMGAGAIWICIHLALVAGALHRSSRLQ